MSLHIFRHPVYREQGKKPTPLIHYTNVTERVGAENRKMLIYKLRCIPLVLCAGTLCNRRGRLARRIAYVLSEASRAGAILVNVKILAHLFLADFFLGILRLPRIDFQTTIDTL